MKGTVGRQASINSDTEELITRCSQCFVSGWNSVMYTLHREPD